MMRKKITEIFNIIYTKYNNSDSISLASGNGGIILFLFYYYRLTLNTKALNLANYILEKTIKIINNGEIYPSFCDGIAGIGWLIEHLEQNNFIECNTDTILKDADHYLFNSMINDFNKGKGYDFLHGAIGKGLYLLKRKNINTIYLENITNCLLETAESPKKDQLTWKSTHHQTGKLIYNLSLSHGITSIINFNSRLYKKGIAKKNSMKIIQNTTNYLLNIRSTNKLSLFPNYIYLNEINNNASRMAWCYGDLGVGITLWQSSQVLNDKKIEKKAIEILLHSSKRCDAIKNFVVDAGLCHGTSGIAHIFNRMHLNSGINEFKIASDFWFEETIKMAKYNDGLAGFKAWRSPKYGGIQNDYGLLEGIAGIGLALISTVSDIEPTWDECLLLS